MKTYSAILLILLAWGTLAAAAPPDWSVAPADFELSASVTAVLYLDFAAAEGAENRIGAFVDGECRGVAAPVQVLDTWMYFLTLFANNRGETVTLKAYLADQDAVLGLEETLAFQSNAVYGSPQEPLALHAVVDYDFAPAVGDIPDQAIEQDGTFAAIDLDEYLTVRDGDAVEWTYSRDSFYLTVEIGPDNVATVSPASPEWTGSGTVTFVAVDQTDGGRTGSGTAVFTVVPVDHPPRVDDIPDQTIGRGGRFAPIRLGDYLREVDGDPVAWKFHFPRVWNTVAPPTWPVDAAAYEQAMTVTAQVAAWGEETDMGNHRLGAFAGDVSGVCRGVAAPVEGLDGPLYFLTVHGSTHGEEIRFFFFDDRTGEILPVRERLSFAASATHGSPTRPVRLQAGYLHVAIGEDAAARVEVVDPEWRGSETIDFAVRDQGTLHGYSGWTAVVFTVLDNHQPVVAGIPDQTIEAGSAFAVFDLDEYLTEPDGDEVSWRVSGNQALSVAIDAANRVTVAPPDAGWTGSETVVFTAQDAYSAWIQLPGEATDNPGAGAAVFTVVPQDHPPEVRDMPGQTIGVGGQFAPIRLDEYLTELDGDGVDWRIVFPPAVPPAAAPAWSVNAAAYERSMSVTAAVTSLGQRKGDGNHLLGAFVGEECRGVASPVAAVDGWVYFLTVYARMNGEEMAFRFFDADAGEILPVQGSVTFQANAAHGTPPQPVELQAGYLLVEIDAQAQARVEIVNPNWTGAEEVRFVAQDAGTLHEYAASDGVVFAVLADYAPGVDDIPDQSVEQGETFAVFDLDDFLVARDGDPILWSASSALALQVSIDAENRVAVTAPDAGWTGSEVVVFTATDATDNRFTASAAATFTVRPLDHQPSVGTIADQAVRVSRSFRPFDLDDYLNEVDGDPVSWDFAFSPADPPADPPAWSVQATAFEGSMSVTAAVRARGQMVEGEAHLLAAFAADPQAPDGLGGCRGVAVPVPVAGSWLFFLNVYANGDGEAIIFRLYDATHRQVWPVRERLTFATNATHGDPSQPFELRAGYLSFAIDAENRVRVEVLDRVWTGSEKARFVATDQGTVRGLAGSSEVVFSVLPELTVYGDVTGDDAINALDAAWILQHVVELRRLSGPDSVAADVNGSAFISSFDASLVLQWVVGDIDSFPVEGGGTGKVARLDRRLWLGEAEETGGSTVVPVWIDAMDGVVAGELSLAVSGDPGGVRIRSGELTSDFLLASGMRDGRLEVAFAGTGSRSGSGRVLELVFDAAAGGSLESIGLVRGMLNDASARTGSPPRPADGRLGPNYPNPFNPETTIRFAVPGNGPVRVDVYSLSGQRVRRLAAGTLTAGHHAVVWDGRDDTGRRVASGVYLCQLEGEGYRAVRKMLLVR